MMGRRMLSTCFALALLALVPLAHGAPNHGIAAASSEVALFFDGRTGTITDGQCSRLDDDKQTAGTGSGNTAFATPRGLTVNELHFWGTHNGALGANDGCKVTLRTGATEGLSGGALTTISGTWGSGTADIADMRGGSFNATGSERSEAGEVLQLCFDDGADATCSAGSACVCGNLPWAAVLIVEYD